MELCTLAGLPQAAAMCEILDESGEALRPDEIQPNSETQPVTPQTNWWAALPYVSTVDLLWFRLLCGPRHECSWKELAVTNPPSERTNARVWQLKAGLEHDVLLPCSVALFTTAVDPRQIRIRLSDGFSEWCTDLSPDACDAEISLFIQDDVHTELPSSVSDFCDLSAREGLRGTKQSVRRALTILRATHWIAAQAKSDLSLHNWCQNIPLVHESDRAFLAAATER
jgi:hypothetical protein